MFEQKLIVNRFINLNLPPAVAPPYANGDFVTVPVQQCYLQESTGVFTKTSAVQVGGGPKAHRNFKWLPWLPGAISEVALVGADVLTGPMSGCWLVVVTCNRNTSDLQSKVFSTCNQQDQKPELSATEPAINGMDLQSMALGQDYLQLKIVQKVSTKRINWTMIDGPDSWTLQAAARCEACRLFLKSIKRTFSAPVEAQISVANKVGPTRMIAGRCDGLQVQLQIMWVRVPVSCS